MRRRAQRDLKRAAETCHRMKLFTNGKIAENSSKMKNFLLF
jgi:hypothetical protein